jgi:methyl-accepting chemotaxis protein
MKPKIKLSVMVIAIMAVAAAGISTLQLSQASAISKSLSLKNIENLALSRAEYWRGRADTRLMLLRSLAGVMSDYENVPAEERRDRFDSMLLGALNTNPDILTLYTVWKPNALDNMDSRWTGRAGSGPDGQYGMAFTRETGEVLGRVTVDMEGSMAYITGPNSYKDRVEHPIPRNILGKDSYLLRFMVPIINPRTNETVGGVGCFLPIDQIQPGLEEIINTHEEISVMAIYSGNGFILSHFIPERIGRMLLDADKEYGDNIHLANQAVLTGKPYRDSVYDPTLETTVEVFMIPFQIGNSDISWSLMIGTPEEYVLREVSAITQFTVILSLVAIAAAAVIIYLVLNRVTKPIVRVADTLKVSGSAKTP